MLYVALKISTVQIMSFQQESKIYNVNPDLTYFDISSVSVVYWFIFMLEGMFNMGTHMTYLNTKGPFWC